MQRAAIATLSLAAVMQSTAAHGQYFGAWPAVPLMLPAGDPYGQSFVRLINHGEASQVYIYAIDDGGHRHDPVVIQLAAGQVFHFNSGDLTDGNAAKGIEGIGPPRNGNWRLRVSTNLRVQILSYVRSPDGALTPMHEIMPTNEVAFRKSCAGPPRCAWLPFADAHFAARTFNPASNTEQQSRLRLVNWGPHTYYLKIVGIDDDCKTSEVRLTLDSGQTRTLTAIDLEQGAPDLIGALGDGSGKWRLYVTRKDAVHFYGISARHLLYSSSGQISNLSAGGPWADVHGDRAHALFATNLDVVPNEYIQTAGEFLAEGTMNYPGDIDYFSVTVDEPGTLFVSLFPGPRPGLVVNVSPSPLAASYDSNRTPEYKFNVEKGTYFVKVAARFGTAGYPHTYRIDVRVFTD